MENVLLSAIEEQANFGFTGRINLVSPNGQLLGTLLMKDGPVVNASFRKLKGARALVSALLDLHATPASFKCVVEPEVVSKSQETMHLTVMDIKKMVSALDKEAQEAHKLRPPNGLKLILSDEFLIGGAEVDREEFNVMRAMTVHSKVEDIYLNCPLQEHQITLALVALRKKGAIKVYKTENDNGG